MYLMRGQYGAALRQLDGARSGGASEPEVENLRGLTMLLSGDAKQSLTAFDRALTLNPALQEARFNRALALMKLGEAARASAELQKIYADEASPLRAAAAYHNGLALDGMKKTAESEQWLERALTLDPSYDAALLYVGMLRERRGDLQGGGRAYFDYLKRHPDSVLAMLRFGISAHRAGRTDVAMSYLKKVTELAPDSPEAVEARKFLVMWE
ncbi:MAG TPA: tetratricopeptide repeat protein [Thermoanaerobaculia bacterium]|jgi:tetratricopeptide (TPR) repeat protein